MLCYLRENSKHGCLSFKQVFQTSPLYSPVDPDLAISQAERLSDNYHTICPSNNHNWSGATCLVLSYFKISSLSDGPSGPHANRPPAALPCQPARHARANSRALGSFTLHQTGFDRLPFVPFSGYLMPPIVFDKWAVDHANCSLSN